MIYINEDKLQVKYVTGLNKCLSGYPTPLDVLYESCTVGTDGNLFSKQKMKTLYGIDDKRVNDIEEKLLNMKYVEKNNDRYKITGTPWE